MQDEPIESMRRVEEYVAMYEGFVRGVRRAGTTIPVGGPTLSSNLFFLEEFLKIARDKRLEIDYLKRVFFAFDDL